MLHSTTNDQMYGSNCADAISSKHDGPLYLGTTISIIVDHMLTVAGTNLGGQLTYYPQQGELSSCLWCHCARNLDYRSGYVLVPGRAALMTSKVVVTRVYS